MRSSTTTPYRALNLQFGVSPDVVVLATSHTMQRPRVKTPIPHVYALPRTSHRRHSHPSPRRNSIPELASPPKLSLLLLRALSNPTLLPLIRSDGVTARKRVGARYRYRRLYMTATSMRGFRVGAHVLRTWDRAEDFAPVKRR